MSLMANRSFDGGTVMCVKHIIAIVWLCVGVFAGIGQADHPSYP